MLDVDEKASKSNLIPGLIVVSYYSFTFGEISAFII
jgi:hypothetical protein